MERLSVLSPDLGEVHGSQLWGRSPGHWPCVSASRSPKLPESGELASGSQGGLTQVS